MGRRKIITTKRNWFDIGASIFFLWGVVNTFFGISRYGIEQGMYFWFCNLALFAVTYGLWKKNTSWLIAWLSFALITQSFWIFDNIWRITTGKNLFGLVEFMYQPGYPLDEFLISHYHFFIIPTIILALLFLKGEGYYAKTVAIVNSVLIFGLSYFLFPVDQNLNCVRESCFNLIKDWKVSFYPFIFTLTIIVVGTVLTHLIERLHKKILFTKNIKRSIVIVYSFIIGFGVILVLVDLSYKKTLPSFTCENSFEDSEIRIECRYTEEFKSGEMLLVYTINNKLSKTNVCDSRISISRREWVMHKNIYLEANKKYTLKFILPYPKENVKAKLSAYCQKF